jgi:tetratricopeptide (TPR) repeat protein
MFCPPVLLLAQAPACPSVPAHSDSPADAAYRDGRYADAGNLYAQALAQLPQDIELSAALVHTWLHEDKVAQASEETNRLVKENPSSAITLTALAEVELRQGEPWLTLQTLDAAAAADPCNARAHLIRARALRINSMYASERAEIQRAYDIDPADPDIQRAWQRVVPAAQEIEGIDQSLATMRNLDADTRQKAEASIHSMMPLLSEHSQTCQILPDVASASLPLQPSYADVKHIDGYLLDVQLPQSKAKLLVDTAASGLYISRKLADENGLRQDPNAPVGTVHVDSIHIGPLEFRDCTVGVSDTPFAGRSDGFIGTDIFASWLISLDFRLARMTLEPLPRQAGLLPGDRSMPPELGAFIPVYHRRQYLLVPVKFKDQSQKLFVLATGMRFSAMTSEAAHSVSKIRVNFTNPEQTASGTKVQFYRDIFDMQFANLPQINQGHLLEFDPSAVEQNAGFQIAGMLGLDVLHSLTLHLDYRDGLAEFESAQDGASPAHANQTMSASASTSPPNDANEPSCQPMDKRDRPIKSTIEAKVTATLDSGHLKPGKEFSVQAVYGWTQPDCMLDDGALLYGHVTAVNSSRNPNSSQLSLVLDHADCAGHPKKEMTLRIIGILAPVDRQERLHDALPTEVAGGARQISDTAAAGGFAFDDNLNPGGPPHSVHPGIVVRMPKAKLEPEGGPGCSARITSTDRSIRLETGSELILTVESAQ